MVKFITLTKLLLLNHSFREGLSFGLFVFVFKSQSQLLIIEEKYPDALDYIVEADKKLIRGYEGLKLTFSIQNTYNPFI